MKQKTQQSTTSKEIKLEAFAYLFMNVVPMHSNLCDGRLMAKRHQMHMSDIRVILGVILQHSHC